MLIPSIRIKRVPLIYCAFIVIAGATLFRFILIWNNWPLLDSDEATMGIMGIRIQQGAHPIFLYGQHYMGAIEGQLGAVFFTIFGVSTISLRLGTLLLFFFFICSMYLLSCTLYNQKFALCSTLLLAIGSNAMLSRQLSATGGYDETLFFAAVAFLLAIWLAFHSRERGWKAFGWRLLGYGGWGLAIGLGLWSDFLILPMAGCTGLILLLFCRRDLLKGASIVILLGFVLGVFPLIVYNLHAAPGQDSWSTLQGIRGAEPLTLDIVVRQIKGTFEVSLPTITGNPWCHVDELLIVKFLGFEPSQAPTTQCHALGFSWSLTYLFLFMLSFVLTLLSLSGILRRAFGTSPSEMLLRFFTAIKTKILLYFLRRQSIPARRQPQGHVATRENHTLFRSSNPLSEKERWDCIRYVAQCMLFVCTAFVIFSYLRSHAPLDDPGVYSRYLVCVWLATPLVLWPLWLGASNVYAHARKASAIGRVCCRLFLVGIVLILLYGSYKTVGELPQARAADQQESRLIASLLQHHITHVYSGYWECDRLAFQSDERIVCGVLSGSCGLLKGNHNRYEPYWTTVSHDPYSSYLMQTSWLCKSKDAIGEKLQQEHLSYRVWHIADYTVYQPIANKGT